MSPRWPPATLPTRRSPPRASDDGDAAVNLPMATTLPMAPTGTPSQELSAQQVAALQVEVRELARTRNAVILAHNYQVAEVQQVADYVGDSLGLSRQAAAAECETIVFCGVHFMAETAV